MNHNLVTFERFGNGPCCAELLRVSTEVHCLPPGAQRAPSNIFYYSEGSPSIIVSLATGGFSIFAFFPPGAHANFLKVEFSLWRRVYISTQVDMGSILERDSFYALHVLHVLSSRFSL